MWLFLVLNLSEGPIIRFPTSSLSYVFPLNLVVVLLLHPALVYLAD